VATTGEVVILDFGCAGELSETTRAAYLALLAAFFQRDEQRMTQAFASLGFRTQSGRADTLLGFMQALLGELADAVQHGSVHWPDRDALMMRARGLGRSLHEDPVVALPDHFVMIGRVLTTLGGLFTHYRPDLDVARHVLPVLARAFEQPI
jgi:ubiquinone biosynthesis protein